MKFNVFLPDNLYNYAMAILAYDSYKIVMLEPGLVWLEFQTTIEEVIALLEHLIVKVSILFSSRQSNS